MSEHPDLLSLVESAEETAAEETGESGFGKIEPVEKVTLFQQDDTCTYHNRCTCRYCNLFACLKFFMAFARMSQIFIAMSSRHVHVFVSDYRIDSVAKIIQ